MEQIKSLHLEEIKELTQNLEILEAQLKAKDMKIDAQSSEIADLEKQFNIQKSEIERNNAKIKEQEWILERRDEAQNSQEENRQLRSDNAFLAEQHMELRKDYEQNVNSYNDLKQEIYDANELIKKECSKDTEFMGASPNISVTSPTVFFPLQLLSCYKSLQHEMETLKNKAEKDQREIDDLRQCIYVLEKRNKELGDSVRAVVNAQASEYQERVMAILNRSSNPTRITRIQEFGPTPSGVYRVNNDRKEAKTESFASRIPSFNNENSRYLDNLQTDLKR